MCVHDHNGCKPMLPQAETWQLQIYQTTIWIGITRWDVPANDWWNLQTYQIYFVVPWQIPEENNAVMLMKKYKNKNKCHFRFIRILNTRTSTNISSKRFSNWKIFSCWRQAFTVLQVSFFRSQGKCFSPVILFKILTFII